MHRDPFQSLKQRQRMKAAMLGHFQQAIDVSFIEFMMCHPIDSSTVYHLKFFMNIDKQISHIFKFCVYACFLIRVFS